MMGPSPAATPSRSRRDWARAEWQRLADRLATVTPQAAARFALVVTVVLVVIWVAIATWPALVPFAAGAGIAYAVFPLVNRLEPLMPRALAALIAVVATLALAVGAIAVVLPALALAVVQLATELPTPEDVDRTLEDLQRGLGNLPPGAQDLLTDALTQLSTRLRAAFDGASGQLANLVVEGARAVVDVIALAIGLIALPTWILTVLRDTNGLRRTIDTRVAPWLRADVWAVARIADRAGREFIRGGLVAAVLVGTFTYLGLAGAGRVGVSAFTQAGPIAVFAGIVQVIPALGVLLGFVPALLILAVSPERAAAYLVVYVLSVWLGRSLIGGRVGGKHLHPALLVPSVVVLSQFGLLPLLLAGPLLATASDLVRYIHGRLSEPPRPAGVIPGEASPAGLAPRVRALIPSVYLARRTR